MPGSFFDTNVLIYIASSDPLKADKAEAIIGSGGGISVQVLNELANVARRKMHRRAVVEFQPELAVQQDRVFHSLCYVHLRSVAIERIGESRQPGQEFPSHPRRIRG